jgi:Fur family ferric uptake transcriptional regulator
MVLPPILAFGRRGAYGGRVDSPELDDALERVRASGSRLTKARRALLEDLYTSSGRATAEELAARHPDVDPATVYRSLSHFEEVGVIEHVHLGHGPASYRWAGARTVAAVCDGCGAVTDIPTGELDALADRLEHRYRLRLQLGHFALSVRCPACVTSSG